MHHSQALAAPAFCTIIFKATIILYSAKSSQSMLKEDSI